MKVIFLDIDGVLNHWDHLQANKSKDSGNMTSPSYLNTKCIQCLNTIISRTNAKVVVSSTWRITHTVESLQETMEAKGFEGEIIDFTTTEDLGTRGDQIWHWLNGAEDLESFVIFDDDADAARPFLGAHYVGTKMMEGGLKDEHVDMATNILEMPLEDL